jgi:hypothetical protein
MTTFEMLTIIGSILIPMLAGFGWIIHRFDSKIDGLKNGMAALSQDLRNLDNRLSRIEGYIDGRDHTLKVKGE